MARRTHSPRYLDLTLFPWLSRAIGEVIYLPTHLTGVAEPPTNSDLFRYAKLTSGLTGGGGYNNGILTSESVTGVAPLVLATAVVSLAGSPMNGQTIDLLNTEGRIIRPSTSSGTKQNDQMQGHWHAFGIEQTFQTSPGTGLEVIYSGNVLALANNYVRAMVSDGTNGTPRVGTDTRMKNIGYTAYQRIL